MFVRLVIAFTLFGSVARADAPEQDPSFVLTIDEPVGKADHKAVIAALREREATLKPAVLAKTKAHPASRLSVTLKLEVQADGSIKPGEATVKFRDAKGEIKDDSLKTTVADAFAKTKKLPKAHKGTTVEVSVAVLQP